jgi:putative methionine-R-sulfoxide reductase with GAF domain
MAHSLRDYDAIVRGMSTWPADLPREERVRRLVDALWEGLAHSGVSWVGVYVAEGEQLVLGPCRDKPACSPIGLHGACGQALLSRQTLIVRDVAELGGNYIACDPRDRSEIVVPLLDKSTGACWGVLDLDSWEVGAFSDADDRGLRMVIDAALDETSEHPSVRTSTS